LCRSLLHHSTAAIQAIDEADLAVAELAKDDPLGWHMRTILSILSPLILAAICACGGSTENPFTAKCKAACQLEETHVCAAEVGKCNADCLSYANQAQKVASSGLGQACGECIASSMSYSTKDGCTDNPACCYGILHKSPGDADCAAVCFEADGGVGY
jgi:hypothetical protein